MSIDIMLHLFSPRKLLTAVGRAACPRLWLPTPVELKKQLRPFSYRLLTTRI